MPSDRASHRPSVPGTTGAAVALMLWCGAAQAQDVANEVSGRDATLAYREGLRTWDNVKKYGASQVRDRSRQEYQPEGLRFGSLLVFPTAEGKVTYDDNIYGRSGRRTGDVITEFAPSVIVQSDLARHSFDFAFGGRFTKYAQHDDYDRIDGFAALNGALHINHAHTLAASIGTDYGHVDAFDPLAPRAGSEPTPVWRSRAAVSLKRDAGRLWGAIGASAARWQYENVKANDGSTIDLSASNLDRLTSSLTLGYRFSPGYEVIGKLRGLRQTSPDVQAGGADAWGWDGAVGIAAELNPLVRWNLFAGYSARQFDAGFEPLNAYTGSAELIWLPTQRLTASLKLERAISEAPNAADGSGLIGDSVRLKLEYDVYRNVLFTIQGEYNNLEFSGSTRRDQLYAGRIGFEYLHSRNTAFTVMYEHQVRTSSIDDADLQRNRITVGGKIRF